MTIHGLAVLAEDLGLAPRATLPGFASGEQAGIN
jgi:hypothetical protein